MKPLQPLSRAGALIVLLHFVVSAVHGYAHTRLLIQLNLWQTIYVVLVITLLPLVSLFLLLGSRRTGYSLLFLSMLGSLVFGVYYHFIAAGPDNVAELGHHSWAAPFQVTAVLLALTEAAGALVGLMGMRRVR